MQRALQLAQLGMGRVSPNPLVGCVIVKEGEIIGEGNHERYGENHAEVNAVQSVRNQKDIKGSTVYVTLEPCAHHGKTPPCANLLVEKGVKKVVVCNLDPNPLVSGKGVQILEKAGLEVEKGLLHDEGRSLNRRFFTFHEKKRPYIILKWAQTADGFIARENYDSKWISSALSRQLVHKWRAEEDAIMVGTHTAQYDDPELTVRDWAGSNPRRIVIDRTLKLDPSLKLFDGKVPTICFNELREEIRPNLHFSKLQNTNPETILNELKEQKLLSVIIEGGSALLQSFIESGYWDEARIFESESSFGSGVSAPMVKGQLRDRITVSTDTLSTYYPLQ